MTQKTDEAGAFREDGGLGEASKWLAGSIPVAVAALTFAGLSGDQLGRVIRVYPVPFVVGVVALVLAVVAGFFSLYNTKRARLWLTVGVATFALGVAMLVSSHAAANSKQDRPTVTTGLTRDAQGLIAEVTVTADGLKPEQYVFVAIQGLNSRQHLDPQAADFSVEQTPIPEGQYSKQRIYSGRIGASPTGHAASTFELPLAKDLYEQYVVQAAILAGSNGRRREREIMSADEETGEFACGPETSNISCITVLLPSPPAATTPPANPNGSSAASSL